MKAFTLIEVMISVIILFISASVFLEITANTKHLVNLYIKKKNKVLKSSVVLEQKVTKNAYEALIGFNIDNDEIIKNLKKDKINIKITKTNNYEILNINNIDYYRFY